MTTVSERLGQILQPDDVVPLAPKTTLLVGRVVGPDQSQPVGHEPELPPEIAERIRERLRARDLEGAADLATKALDSLGIEPDGVRDGVPGQRNGLVERAEHRTE